MTQRSSTDGTTHVNGYLTLKSRQASGRWRVRSCAPPVVLGLPGPPRHSQCQGVIPPNPVTPWVPSQPIPSLHGCHPTQSLTPWVPSHPIPSLDRRHPTRSLRPLCSPMGIPKPSQTLPGPSRANKIIKNTKKTLSRIYVLKSFRNNPEPNTSQLLVHQ